MRRLLLLAGAVVFLDTMFFAALTPLLPHYAEELELSKAGAGILQAAYPAGALVGAIPSGIVAGRVGVKASVLVGLGTTAAMSVAFGLADSEWLLDTARFLQGVASGFSWTGALAWAVATARRERRGRELGLAMGAAIAGGLLGPVLGAAASLVGARSAFSAVGATALVLAVWAARSTAPKPGEPQPARALLAAIADRQILFSAWFVLLPGLLFGALSVLAPLRLSELGFGAVAIGAMFLTSGVLESGLSPLLGRVVDRDGPLLPIQVALPAAAALCALLPWPDSAWALAALVVGSGLCFGGFWVPGFALLTERSEARGLDYAYGFALMNLAWAPGQGGGAAVAGIVADATSDAVPYLSLSAICLATLAVVRRSRARGAVARGAPA
jgi:MFS family permease